MTLHPTKFLKVIFYPLFLISTPLIGQLLEFSAGVDHNSYLFTAASQSSSRLSLADDPGYQTGGAYYFNEGNQPLNFALSYSHRRTAFGEFSGGRVSNSTTTGEVTRSELALYLHVLNFSFGQKNLLLSVGPTFNITMRERVTGTRESGTLGEGFTIMQLDEDYRLFAPIGVGACLTFRYLIKLGDRFELVPRYQGAIGLTAAVEGFRARRLVNTFGVGLAYRLGKREATE